MISERLDPAVSAGQRGVPMTTIDELEKILNSQEELEVQINPDGSITAVAKGTAVNSQPRILTLEEALATCEEPRASRGDITPCSRGGGLG